MSRGARNADAVKRLIIVPEIKTRVRHNSTRWQLSLMPRLEKMEKLFRHLRSDVRRCCTNSTFIQWTEMKQEKPQIAELFSFYLRLFSECRLWIRMNRAAEADRGCKYWRSKFALAIHATHTRRFASLRSSREICWIKKTFYWFV